MPSHKKIPAAVQKRIDAAELQAYAPISIDGPDVAGRIWLAAQHQLGGEQLSLDQVAAVTRAFADYSLNQRMVSDTVADLAIRPLAFSEPDEPDLAHGLGRWFHGVADRLKKMEWEATHGR